MKLWNWGCVALIVPLLWLGKVATNTDDVHAVIIAKSNDQVKVGKSGAQNRYQVAVKNKDQSSTTLDVPLDYYVQAKVGDHIVHKVRSHSNTMGFVLVLLISIMLTLSILFGFVPAILTMIESIHSAAMRLRKPVEPGSP